MSSEKPRAGSRRKVFLQSALWVTALFSLAGALALAQPLPSTSPIITPSPPPAPTPQPVTPTPTPASSAQVVRGADVDFPTPADARADEPLVKFGRPAPRANYGSAGNREAARLRSMPPERFDYDRSVLRDVLRSLATQAGIPYVGIPEHSREAQHLVTFKMTASPFAALESLARQNDVKLTYEDGVWFMNFRKAERRRIENESELIGVIYQLRHDPLDVVTFDPGPQENNEDNSDSLVGQNDNTSGASRPRPAKVPLQSSQLVFRVGMPVVVNQIRAMLGISPIEKKGGSDGSENLPPSYYAAEDPKAEGGVILDGDEVLQGEDVGRESADGEGAGGTTINVGDGNIGLGGGRGGAGGGGRGGGGGGLQQPGTLFPVYVPPQKPQVIYNSDTNILWIVATRKQHKWVADYLRKVDKPQNLIAIEVKFFETTRNPRTDFGINWEGVFGGEGLQVTGAAAAGLNGRTETGRIAIDGNFANGSFNAPYSAVLSVEQATLAVQAFARDRDGSFVQYPRVLTINNKEVAITSAEQTPISSGTTAVGGNGTSTQNVGTVTYLPTGTQINILPKSIGKDQIALTVAITISAIVGEKQLDIGTGPNQYPITTSRVYNAALQVDSGYTLAVGGLEKTTDVRETGGLPLLKDIPGLGYLFKNKGRSRDRSNLIIFITPYLIDDPSRTPGISETPESTLPVRPGVPPPAPNFSPDGRLVGGDGAVAPALAWAEYQLKYFRQINAESRDDAKTIGQLRGVIERVRALSNFLQAQTLDAAGYAPSELLDNSARADALLFDLNKVLAAAQLDQFQLREGIP